MSNTKTVIELNGKRYDAGTGAVLADDVAQPAKKQAAKVAPKTAGSNVDGFFRASSSASSRVPTLPVPKKPKGTTSPVRQHKPAMHPHKPQRAQTLMRHVVKKPDISVPKKVAKAAAYKSDPGKASGAHSLLLSHEDIIRQRQNRAKHIAKSPIISRFGSVSLPSITKRTAHVPVQPAPIEKGDKPTHRQAKPSHAAFSHHPSASATAHATSHKSSQSTFSAALEHADTHTHPKLPRKHRLHHRAARKLGMSPKTANISAISLAAILLVGFIAYQNVPNFALRIASNRAGFQAAMPAYQPAGFTFDTPIQADPGSITLRFHSTTDNRNYTVSQRPTNWNSDALLNNFVATTNQPYQAYSDHGKTIYLYGNSNATWVNGGKWYQIEGESNLSHDQLLRLANSM